MVTNGFYLKLRSLFTALFLAVSAVAYADVYSGTDGKNIVWTLDAETGILEISGAGATMEHGWKDYSEYIKKVIVSDGITHVADAAFKGCTNMVEAVIGDDVDRIGYYAFQNCSSLEKVDFGNGVRSFGGYAFRSCKSLKTVELPNSLQYIEGGAFSFSGLQRISIPASVTMIDLGIFDYCEDLEYIVVDDANPVYDSRNGCNAIIETSTGLLMEGCNATIIPDGITAIGNGAFGGCRKLTDVRIPSTVTNIDAYAFFECNAIKTMTSFIAADNLMEVMTCAFDGMNRGSCILYVPKGAKGVYAITGGWKDFVNIREMDDTTEGDSEETPDENADWMFVLTEADGLLGEEMEGQDVEQYRFKSTRFVLPSPTTSIRFTVKETESRMNSNGYCFTAFGEFTILNADGNAMPYIASSNADHNMLAGFDDGGGLAALNDGDYSTYFHTVWSGNQAPTGCHYVEFAFEEPVNEFSLDIVWREGYDGKRLRATLAYVLPGGSEWNGEYPGGDESDENVDNVVITEGEVVDLGLSVKWANCNVGATAPEEYGCYFAWGETKEKSYYNWSTYKWGTENNITKYCFNESNGFADNKSVLDTDDDAANVNLGGGWRMPTRAEAAELVDKCTWEWVRYNGVNGYKVTGPNGNSIFLPANGYKNGEILSSAGESGGYWLSTMNEYNDSRASYLDFYGDVHIYDYGTRNSGHCVRPVMAKDSIDSGNEEVGDDSDEDFDEVVDNVVVTEGKIIDLGLSVKWASVNVGAVSPEEFGDYFSWDGTDIANALLGDKWFMPTLEEGQELIDNCAWEWVELNGVTGYKVTGPNGNSIFLPATGWKHSDESDDVSVGVEGNYWTITPSESYQAYDLQFHDNGRIFMSPFGVISGFQSIRAVYREDYVPEEETPVKRLDIDDCDSHFTADSVDVYDVVTYTRVFDTTGWEAWYMPFDVPYSSLEADLEVAYLNNVHQYDDDNDGVIDRTEIEAIKLTDGLLKANFPYVVKAKNSCEFFGEWENVTIDALVNSYSCSSMYNTYTFCGNYDNVADGQLQGAYILDNDGYMVPSENMCLNPFRFYLTIEDRGMNGPSMSASIRLRVRGDESTTGIENVGVTENNVIYDLSGRVVTEVTEPGIYIVNGRKMVIR